MIGNELVEQIVFRFVVVVALCFGIDALAVEISHHVFQRYVFNFFSDGFFPELVSFSEEGKAVVTMFRCVEGRGLTSGFFVLFGYLTLLEEVLVGIVAIGCECVEQSACIGYLCRNYEA